jgi:hypothetical protein
MRPKRIPTIRSRLILLVMACLIPATLMVVALLAYDPKSVSYQFCGG